MRLLVLHLAKPQAAAQCRAVVLAAEQWQFLVIENQIDQSSQFVAHIICDVSLKIYLLSIAGLGGEYALTLTFKRRLHHPVQRLQKI